MRRSLPDLRKASQRRMAELRARQAALRAKLRNKPRGPGRDRRRWWLVVLLVLLLWLLLRGCRCTEAPAPAAEPEGSGGFGVAHLVGPPAPEILPDRVARRPRPAFEAEPAGPLPWVVSFRGQVAARSPRLAACFVGVERPGRLKWTVSVEPVHGNVSDHSLEPTLQSDVLSQKQRACVIEVLSDPPYRLEAGEGRSTPSRVGMVIEF